LWSSKDYADFIKLSKILKSPLLPFLYRYLNFSPKFILPKSFGDHKISKQLLKQYTRPFANKTQRNGTMAFAKSLLNDQDWFEQLWNKRQIISSKPTLFIWGMKDTIIKPQYLELQAEKRNKAAGTRACKTSLVLEKLLKEFRKASLEASKN